MSSLIRLNVFETTLAVPYGIELRSRYTAVRCTTSLLRHVLSPFYLSVDGLTLFNGYQPINCYESSFKGKNAPAFPWDAAHSLAILKLQQFVSQHTFL